MQPKVMWISRYRISAFKRMWISVWGKVIQEVFPGCPQMKKGYMYLNEAPGIGVDIDEKLAARYPFQPFPAGTGFRFPIRKADGTQIRP